MKSCIHKNGQTSVCLTKLQQQGLIGPGEIFRRLVVYKIKKVKGTNLRTKVHLKAAIKHHRRPISLKFKNGRLLHEGKGEIKMYQLCLKFLRNLNNQDIYI